MSKIDLKVLDYEKRQQLEQRRLHAIALAHRLHAAHAASLSPVQWAQRASPLFVERLLRDLLRPDTPTRFELREVYAETLRVYAPCRLDEERARRRERVEAAIASVLARVRRESEESYDTIRMTKNDMTVRLTEELGEMPLKEEVDSMWDDRFQVPTIEWVGFDD